MLACVECAACCGCAPGPAAQARYGDIDTWETSAVKSMDGAFDPAKRGDKAKVFNANIDSWQTSAVTSMNNMFNGARAFNQALVSWQMSAVTDMSGMFRNAQARYGDICTRSTITCMSDCNKAAIATAWKAQVLVADSRFKGFFLDWSKLPPCSTCTHP